MQMAIHDLVPIHVADQTILHPQFSSDLEIGIYFIFNFIFRRPETLERMQKVYSDGIGELKEIRDIYNIDPTEFTVHCKEQGFQLENNNPNICQSNIFALLMTKIGRLHKWPCVIKKINIGRLITCDNPVLRFDMKYGNIYLLTLDPTHYICFGYYQDNNLFNQVIK